MATRQNSTSPTCTGQLPVRAKGHTKCLYHRENELVLVCQVCNILICTTCSITTHKTHIDSFVEISKIREEQHNILKGFINILDNSKIRELKTEIHSRKEEISRCEASYKNLSNNIHKQREQCKQDLDRITDDYLATCKKMETATTDLLRTNMSDLEDKLDTWVKLSSECKQTLQTGTAVLVYDSVSEIEDMDLDIRNRPNIEMTELIPSNNRQILLEQAMGKMKTPNNHLKAGSEPTGHSKPGSKQSKPKEIGQASTGAVPYKLYDSPNLISKFLCPDTITSICPTPDGRAWLCDWNTNAVILINNKGTFFTNKAKVIRKIKHKSNITNISLDPTTGRLWFCCRDEKTIYEVSTSSSLFARFTTEDNPVSLCVTKDGSVVVGTQGKQGNKLVMYTAGGQVLHSATVEESGTGAVRSITQCGVTGNIAVVSQKLIRGDMSESSDRNTSRQQIIVYNPTLQPLVHYRGEAIQAHESVTPDKFDPYNIVYDSKGNIVIADWKRNTIELISGTGKYIKKLHKNKGYQGTVGIQKDDVLWSRSVFDTEEWGINLLKYYSD